jgi:flagellar biogenesis protein FliO
MVKPMGIPMLLLRDFYILFTVIAILGIIWLILRRIHHRRRRDLKSRFRRKE